MFRFFCFFLFFFFLLQFVSGHGITLAHHDLMVWSLSSASEQDLLSLSNVSQRSLAMASSIDIKNAWTLDLHRVDTVEMA